MRSFKSLHAARAQASQLREVLPIKAYERLLVTKPDTVKIYPPIPTEQPIPIQVQPSASPFGHQRENTNTRTTDIHVALQDIQAMLTQHAQILQRLDSELKSGRRNRKHDGIAKSASVDPNRMVDVTFLSNLIGVNRSTIYAWVAAGKFVKQTPLSNGTSRWQLEEVEAWLEANREARSTKKCRAPKVNQQTPGMKEMK